jgi:Tol biopolymer transport system component
VFRDRYVPATLPFQRSATLVQTTRRVTVPRLGAITTMLALGCIAGPPAAPAAGAGPAPVTVLESLSSTGVQGNLSSFAIGISARGRFVLFNSDATNLVPGDTNARTDAFVRDRRTGRTTRVSVSSSGQQARPTPDPFGGSFAGGMSADARFVVLRSDAPSLVPGDTNGVADIFVHDRWTHRTTRVDAAVGGGQSNGWSGQPAISADGRFVAFTSSASNLVRGDTNGRVDVFVRDRRTGQTRRVSVSSGGRQANGDSESPAITAHGRYVVFATNASTLVPGDTNGLEDIFVRDRGTGRTERVSVASTGAQSSGSPTHSGSNAPVVSAHGRFVAFHSDASNLVPADTNTAFDIFLRDRLTHTTRRVSVGDAGEQANAETLGPAAISAGGRYVAFASLATNLVAGDRNGITDVFIRDRVARTTRLASLSSAGRQGTDSSWPAAFSTDARHLVFSSWAGDLVAHDRSPGPDVFVRDFQPGGGP